MIPGSFAYHRPKSVAEATGLLAQFADNARILAGGQSLIPMMKLRFAGPDHLIDLAALPELKGIERKANTLRIGAMTTQHELIASALIAETVPIICRDLVARRRSAGPLPWDPRRQSRQRRPWQ